MIRDQTLRWFLFRRNDPPIGENEPAKKFQFHLEMSHIGTKPTYQIQLLIDISQVQDARVINRTFLVTFITFTANDVVLTCHVVYSTRESMSCYYSV